DQGKVAWVERDRCVACLTCVRVCPWGVPKIDAQGVADIRAKDCRACGICVGECPAQAIRLNESEDERRLAACASGR
ncbi:MAG: 4Fe-4S binding protein, partial [Desulfobacteraceae bacterium]|nr:4Fe-4S binding protein [Desulfobacteraceae bacterium]